MVLRALAFASEALTDIGFAGATGSALLGLTPFWGMLGLSLLVVLTLGALRDRLKGRDVEVGMVLSFALGLGCPLPQPLFAFERHPRLFWSANPLRLPHEPFRLPSSRPPPRSLGPSSSSWRRSPVLFSSLPSIPTPPGRKGCRPRRLDFVYLVLLAATTVVSIQAIGVLLAFALLSAPAGAAHRLTRNPGLALLVCPPARPRNRLVRHPLGFFRALEQNTRGGLHRDSFSAIVYGLALLRDRFRIRSRHEVHRHRERETND